MPLIRITGPESTGKTTLATTLAWCLDGIYVPEEARPYLQSLERPYRRADLDRIWTRQLAAEDRARSSGASYVICDTGPEVLKIWSQARYGACSPLLAEATAQRRYDLTLLCSPDLPWAPDPLREHPRGADRHSLFDRYAALLPEARTISGAHRIAKALNAIDRQFRPSIGRRITAAG